MHYASKIIKSDDLERWRVKKRIEALDESEKAILREFFIQERRLIKLALDEDAIKQVAPAYRR
jgi:hypothetical protein